MPRIDRAPQKKHENLFGIFLKGIDKVPKACYTVHSEQLFVGAKNVGASLCGGDFQPGQGLWKGFETELRLGELESFCGRTQACRFGKLLRQSSGLESWKAFVSAAAGVKSFKC